MVTCGSSQSFLVLAGKKRTKKRQFPLREKTMAEIKLRVFFFSDNFNLRGCAEVAATGGTRRVHHFTHVKMILRLADSNYITWAPSISCCLLLRPPVSKLGNLHTRPSESEELQNFPSQSPCALTRVPTTLAFFNGV